MKLEKAKGPSYEAIFLRQGDILSEMVNDFTAGRPLNWPVLPQSLVHRVWSDFVREGYVRDERALDNIYACMRDNVLRLQISNTVAGHDVAAPEDLLEDVLSADRHEEFSDWLIESEDGWRISDYGIGPLTDALALAHEARTSSARLKYLDRALHVTHMRGDLSKLFVEGGRGTVMELAELEPNKDLQAA